MFSSLPLGLRYCDDWVNLRWHFFSIRLDVCSNTTGAEIKKDSIGVSVLVSTHVLFLAEGLALDKMWDL